MNAGTEWGDFTESLFDAVQQQLEESHVNSFLDLSEAEKVFVLEKAAKAIQGGDPYKALVLQVNACLEEQIRHQVAQEMVEGEWVKNRSALVLDHLKNGMMTLLEERPNLKGRLRSLFNQLLPADLRRLTWRLYLANTKARSDYLSCVAVNRATSLKDREIALKCQALLDSEPTFQHLKNNKAAEKQCSTAFKEAKQAPFAMADILGKHFWV